MKYAYIETISTGSDAGSIKEIIILDLTEQEAIYYKDLCKVKEKLAKYTINCKLIPESTFGNKSLDSIITIPETIVASVNTPHFTSYTSMKNISGLLYINLQTIDYVKKTLKISDEDKLRDIADKLEQITGFYYHKEIKNGTSYLYPHEFYFVIHNIKKILSEMTYEEFESHIRDKIKKLLESYLKNDYDGNLEKMNRHPAFKILSDDFNKIE